ncbi:hypothetical protein FQA47_003864 [Oryzias melastigma]|uniref:Uncharacterized protein n=1 Tax=Oryzias melastigma TaxID=30732 RepID=A0A834FDN8_ORYME|nr:hypothetical protein FQA47_003864 [Oryzias melastigma]
MWPSAHVPTVRKLLDCCKTNRRRRSEDSSCGSVASVNEFHLCEPFLAVANLYQSLDFTKKEASGGKTNHIFEFLKAGSSLRPPITCDWIAGVLGGVAFLGFKKNPWSQIANIGYLPLIDSDSSLIKSFLISKLMLPYQLCSNQ